MKESFSFGTPSRYSFLQSGEGRINTKVFSSLVPHFISAMKRAPEGDSL
jgi:hypothetical protein